MLEAATDALYKATDCVNREGKYLTLFLADEEYGISILKIKEIIGMMPITTVPQTPEFFKGVINLRGKVIPVIDLRLRFGINATSYSERTCIIVVEIMGQNGAVLTGIVVDTVSEVLNVNNNEIEDTPHLWHNTQHRLHFRNGKTGRRGQKPSGYRPNSHCR